MSSRWTAVVVAVFAILGLMGIALMHYQGFDEIGEWINAYAIAY